MEFNSTLNSSAFSLTSRSKLIFVVLIFLIGLGQMDLVLSQAEEPVLTG